jgi:hypothetical protein
MDIVKILVLKLCLCTQHELFTKHFIVIRVVINATYSEGHAACLQSWRDKAIPKIWYLPVALCGQEIMWFKIWYLPIALWVQDIVWFRIQDCFVGNTTSFWSHNHIHIKCHFLIIRSRPLYCNELLITKDSAVIFQNWGISEQRVHTNVRNFNSCRRVDC